MKSTRGFCLTLVFVLLLTLAIPVFADEDGYQRNHDEWYRSSDSYDDNELMDFTEIDEHRVRMNDHEIKFDSPPVIKSGRTLIPVRAIIEGLGGTVTWNGTDMTVTITHPDSDNIIVFNLKTGVVTVDEKAVTIDVRPGLHNNRTYVPLRFIAETFGLRVSHDSQTGKIDIEDGPKLVPSKVSFEDSADIKDVLVNMTLNDFTFKGIKDLNKNTDYTVDGSKVTIKEGYISDLMAEKTVLSFEFKDNADNVVLKSFKIILDYAEDDEEADEPSIHPDEIVFASMDDVDDVTVTMTLNGYEFKGIQDLVKPSDYTVAGNEVTILKNYIKAQDDEELDLEFVFAKDGDIVKEDFEITLGENEDEDQDNEEDAVLNPEKADFDSLEAVTDVNIDLILNGHTLKGIMNDDEELIEDEDYSINNAGDKVTLFDDYLKSLGDGDTELTFQFENGEHMDIDFEVEID